MQGKLTKAYAHLERQDMRCAKCGWPVDPHTYAWGLHHPCLDSIDLVKALKKIEENTND